MTDRREFLLAGGVLLLGGAVPEAFAVPIAGKDFAAVTPPQATETGAKIEVVEFFSYGCPHCYELEPKLAAWVKALPADTAMRRVPISFGRQEWANLAKAYFALEAVGATARLHGKVFDAIHGDKLHLEQPDTLFDWVAKQGLDRRQFSDAFNSFGVQSRIARLNQVTRDYGIDGVPALVIDGKYRTSGSLTGSHDAMLRAASELIALARSERGGAKK